MNQIQNLDQKEVAAHNSEDAVHAANMEQVDERIKYWLSLEMKKVSQMLIQNLTVFVQQATKLQMEQAMQPDMIKQAQRLTSVEKQLTTCMTQVEKVVKEQARQSMLIKQKTQHSTAPAHSSLALKADQAQARAAGNTQTVVLNQQVTHPDRNLTKRHDLLEKTSYNKLIDQSKSEQESNPAALVSIFGAGNKLI